MTPKPALSLEARMSVEAPMLERTAPAQPGRRPLLGGRPRLRGAGAVVAGLVVGVALTAAVPRLLDGGGSDGARTVDADLGELVTAPDLAAGAGSGGTAAAAAGSPAAAVRGFLDAELAGDLDTSFAYLP